MSVPYRMITEQTRDEKFHEIIFKYYEDFKKFMRVDTLPKFTIQPITKPRGTAVAFITNPTEANQQYTFNMNKMTAVVLGQRAIPTIYHEFVHIYDDVYFLLGVPNRKYYLTTYTEFHATFVQVMVATGYSSYYNDKKISVRNRVMNGMHNCSIEEYFNEEYQYNKTSLSVDTLNIKESFRYLYMLMVYYIAKIYFTQNYITENTTNLFSLKPFIKIFGDRVLSLKELLFDNDTSNEHLLEITKIQNEIILEFEKHYC